MARERLDDRRPSVNLKVTHTTINGNEQTFHITCGFAAGKIREVFIARNFKTGTDLGVVVTDACCLISLLLQHGYTPEMLVHKFADPPSLIGSIVRAAAQLDKDATDEERGLKHDIFEIIDGHRHLVAAE